MKQIIQREADRSTDWVRDNKMVCAGDKTKLLVVGTRQLRESKLVSQNKVLEVNVEGNTIRESKSEKLLGLTVNNELTWKEYLYGEDWRPEKENLPGLIPLLSQRVGMLSRLAKIVPKKRFNTLCNGIFNSKLIYCLQVVGNVWGFGLDETARRSSSFRKEDLRKLQVLQNKVARLSTAMKQGTPTRELLAKAKMMSVHQLVGYHTLLTVQKTVTNRKPDYIYSRLSLQETVNDGVVAWRQVNKVRVDQRLTIAREAFMYRGGLLWNSLPVNLRMIGNSAKFKGAVKSWIKEHIPVKPP